MGVYGGGSRGGVLDSTHVGAGSGIDRGSWAN